MKTFTMTMTVTVELDVDVIDLTDFVEVIILGEAA